MAWCCLGLPVAFFQCLWAVWEARTSSLESCQTSSIQPSWYSSSSCCWLSSGQIYPLTWLVVGWSLPCQVWEQTYHQTSLGSSCCTFGRFFCVGNFWFLSCFMNWIAWMHQWYCQSLLHGVSWSAHAVLLCMIKVSPLGARTLTTYSIGSANPIEFKAFLFLRQVDQSGSASFVQAPPWFRCWFWLFQSTLWALAEFAHLGRWF